MKRKHSGFLSIILRRLSAPQVIYFKRSPYFAFSPVKALRVIFQVSKGAQEKAMRKNFLDRFLQTQKLPFYGRMAIVGGRLIFVFSGGGGNYRYRRDIFISVFY